MTQKELPVLERSLLCVLTSTVKGLAAANTVTTQHNSRSEIGQRSRSQTQTTTEFCKSSQLERSCAFSALF
jgi:cell division protein FtsL